MVKNFKCKIQKVYTKKQLSLSTSSPISPRGTQRGSSLDILRMGLRLSLPLPSSVCHLPGHAQASEESCKQPQHGISCALGAQGRGLCPCLGREGSGRWSECPEGNKGDQQTRPHARERGQEVTRLVSGDSQQHPRRVTAVLTPSPSSHKGARTPQALAGC